MNDSQELLQGTLELLVLKALSLEPMHGWGIAKRIVDFLITHTNLSRVLQTPGLTSSLSSTKTSSLVSARSGSMTNCGLKATWRSGPL